MTRRFVLTVEGLDGTELEIVGATWVSGQHVIEIGPDRTAEARVLVTRHGARLSDDSVPVTFVITDKATGESTKTSDNFRGPHK